MALTHLDEGVLASDVSATTFVAHECERFAGFCTVAVDGRTAMLPALFVQAKLRSNGIAKQLVAKCVSHAASRGSTWVFTARPPAGVPFLEQLGFGLEYRDLVPTGVLARFEAAGGRDLVVLSMKVRCAPV